MRLPSLLVLLGMVCLTGCNGEKAAAPAAAAFDLNDARSEITASYPAFTAAAVKGDSAALHGIYHSQSRVYPAHGPMMEGPAAAASLFASFSRMGITNVKAETTEVMGGPEEVVELGTYELFGGDNSIDKGKYMVVWKQEGGKWKNYRDIWNSDLPAPGGQ